ncbi:MAG: SIMPL domain-containing protein [Burkholderiales bacterium]|nr:SIMPL domain-containing protein [Burkholderiales bacterium]
MPQAQAEGVRNNVVSFQASATREVTQDLMVVTLQATREGTQAGEVQAALKQLLDAALTEAKSAAVAGAMDVNTGYFSVSPRYGNNRRISGWQGSAQLVLQGTDTARIAQTVGKLNQLNVVNVVYGLSRDLRDKHESALTAQAIARFRQRADELAKGFGFASYALGEVTVQSGEPGFGGRPMLMAARASIAEMADAPLPVEPGKGILTVTVSGQVILSK